MGFLGISKVLVGKLPNEASISPADSRYRSHGFKTLFILSSACMSLQFTGRSSSVKAKQIAVWTNGKPQNINNNDNMNYHKNNNSNNFFNNNTTLFSHNKTKT